VTSALVMMGMTHSLLPGCRPGSVCGFNHHIDGWTRKPVSLAG